MGFFFVPETGLKSIWSCIKALERMKKEFKLELEIHHEQCPYLDCF